MTFLIPGDRILLTGDSITDWGRDRRDPADLGAGYALLVASLAGARRPDLGLMFLNRGVGGDTCAQLLARWDTDAIALAPTVISIMIGINDTWRRAETGTFGEPDAFEATYRALLTRTRDRLDARLVLIEPFLVPVAPDQHAWRPDLEPRIEAVRGLAAEFDALLVPADGLFTVAAARTSPESWAFDGVHPTAAGHGLLAEAWLDAVGVG